MHTEVVLKGRFFYNTFEIERILKKIEWLTIYEKKNGPDRRRIAQKEDIDSFLADNKQIIQYGLQI